ncbi:MAG: PilZ domain-containing protein [Gammaproteobacteria bacterium]|nr:PilZ domain-containing protein [Gammaproteobacteria bacterium]
MSRDHRWSIRKNVGMDVTLHSTQTHSVRGRLINASLEGMLIQPDQSCFAKDTDLEVSFTMPGKNESHHRVRAHVVHNGIHGIGLMLKHMCHTDIHAMQQLVRP